MAGYIGSKSSVTQVDGYNKTEADAEFLNDPASVITVAGSNVGIGTATPSQKLMTDGNIFASTGDGGGYLLEGGNAILRQGATGMAFNTNSAERIRIDGSGRVGIGTSSPTYKLDTNNGGASVAAIRVTGNDQANVRLRLENSGSGGRTWEVVGGRQGTENSSFSIYDATGGATRMLIDSSGSVLVGKTTGGAITGSGMELHPNYAMFAGYNTNSPSVYIGANGPTGQLVSWYYTSTLVGSVTTNGSSTSYNTTSDYRLKENITPIQGAADIVKMMRPCTYTFKSDGSWVDGFLAHELQELHPRAVTGSKDAMKDEEYEVTPAVEATYAEDGTVITEAVPAVMGTRSVPDYQGVDYSKLTPILTAALQEALTEIAALKVRVAALEVTP